MEIEEPPGLRDDGVRERRTGILLSALLTAGVWVAFVLRFGSDSDEMLSLAGQMALSLMFSILLGLWISQVVEQSQERAVLLQRLHAAQAELGRSHHAAGVAAERERMAQEIHDTLAQGFTSIVMLSQTAEQDLRRGRPEQAADRIALVERTARENLAEARALVAAFAPVGLEGSSLGEALERLARRFEEETGVRVAVRRASAGAPIGREHEVVLLRAAQEALSNVRRHADARHVELVLAGGAGNDEVRLEVVDDGRGMDPDQAEGFGLRGMRERVTSGGGELRVSRPAAGGTRVLVTLPAREDGP
ncbi:MAG: sensor histidine kinase [Actinotalea sp.]|nr:sensor histidine kinase [Actinotalea sp.]